MSSQYFDPTPASAHDLQWVHYSVLDHAFTCATDSGVFSRDGLDEGSRYLLEALRRTLPTHSMDILDLGCGWGAIGMALGKCCPCAHILMAEVNQRAARLAEENCAKNSVTNATILLSDGFSAICGRFDAIVTNPPIRAGKPLIYGWFTHARDFLKPGGALYIVIRKQQGAPSAHTFLTSLYPHVEILDKLKGFWVIKASIDH